MDFSFDPEFTDDNATRMILADDTSVMLAVEPFFKEFIAPQEIADASTSREVIVGLSADSRDQVDDLIYMDVSAALDGFVADESGSAERLYPDLGALHGTPYMNARIDETGVTPVTGS